MATTPEYSTLFSCLYDEPEPVGSLGRGTHYSVFRCVEWLDVMRQRRALPEIHDFAVVWDEDHDVRVIEAVERIYMAGLLSPVQFIGERKGGLTVILAAKFYFGLEEAELAAYTRQIEEICSDLDGDTWCVAVGSFDRQPGSPHQTFTEGLINAEDRRVNTYLANIDSLWGLGTKPFTPTRAAQSWPAPAEAAAE